MPNIKVVGQTSTYDLETIKESVILLGGQYYFKHDEENLIKVKTPGGGYRLYRKNSPKIVKTVDNNYHLKADCVEIDTGIYLAKNSPNTVKLENDTFTHINWCATIHNKRYLKTDPRLTKTRSGGYALKDEVIQLNERVYGKDQFEPLGQGVVETSDGFYLEADTRKVTFWEDGRQQFRIIGKDRVSNGNYVPSCFAGFKDGNNPQLGRYEQCLAERTAVVGFPLTGGYCLSQQLTSLTALFEELAMSETIKNTEEVRKKLNSRFSDSGEEENTAKVISKDYQTWGGKQHLFGHIGEPVLSKLFTKTGGIGYTFGVELETSAGLVPEKYAAKMGFEAVGDRSIGAGEYVSPILQGNRGIKYLKEFCDIVADHCFVDDRCAVHFHVGSPPVTSATNWKIGFDWRFAAASMKLGTLIEEELYQMLPKSRNPYNRHCHSIMRYSGVNEDNWREMLGDFVFGPEENWGRTHDMRLYKYGEGEYDKKHGLSTWCGGRYKWLNLVRCYSRCNSPTFEIRIWSPSTNFDKIYNYCLLTLAFVYVAEHNYKEIMAGEMDLKQMIHFAYADDPSLLERLIEFVDQRKKKFNRKVVYTGVKPEEIKSILSTTLLKV